MGIIYFLPLQPVDKIWEIFRNVGSLENSIDHMTAKQPHFYFILQMWVNFSIVLDHFKNVRGCGSVRFFKIVKSFFVYLQGISKLEVFDWHIVYNILDQDVGVFKRKLRFKLFFLKFYHKKSIIICFGALLPSFRINIC